MNWVISWYIQWTVHRTPYEVFSNFMAHKFWVASMTSFRFYDETVFCAKTILLEDGFNKPDNVLIFFVILSAPAFHLKLKYELNEFGGDQAWTNISPFLYRRWISMILRFLASSSNFLNLFHWIKNIIMKAPSYRVLGPSGYFIRTIRRSLAYPMYVRFLILLFWQVSPAGQVCCWFDVLLLLCHQQEILYSMLDELILFLACASFNHFHTRILEARRVLMASVGPDMTR